MEKIVLKDNTEIEILPGASLGETTVIVPDFADLKTVAEALTKEGNLDTVQYKSEEQITGEYANMKLETPLFKSVDYTQEKKVIATFAIREKTEMEKRMDAMEKEMKGFKAEQVVQDGAIADLGGVVSELAEGGKA